MKINYTLCLLCCCLLLSSWELRAQEIAAKSFSLSGTANLELIDKSEAYNYRSEGKYSASIQANYFLWKNMSLNAGYRYGSEKGVARRPIDISYKNEYQGGFIQLRRYWFFNKYLGMYVGAEYEYRLGTKTENHQVVNKGYQHFIGLIPGIFVFPFEKLGIEMSYGSLGYRHTIMKDPVGAVYGRSSGLNFNFTPNLNFGVHYFISRK